MIINVKDITGAVKKISNITSGDKQVPGVLLRLNEEALLDVCYSDGRKSFIETLNVTIEDTDKIGSIAVDFSQFKRAIDNCQPSGNIHVSDVAIKYNETTITVSVDQIFEITDEEGNVIESRVIANKHMDVAWTEPGSNMKTAILTRMDYDSIFECDTVDDEFDKDEFINALNVTSTEKGRHIYMATKSHTLFVVNQSHVTSVPISKREELTTEELDEIRGELSESPEGFSEEAYEKAIASRVNRMHYSVVMDQGTAKSIIGTFSDVKADKIYLHTKDKFCSIYVDTTDDTTGGVVEHVGFWFGLAVASKAHLGSVERYNSLGYKSYQTKFMQEFLADSIKSALAVSDKTNKVAFTFDTDQNGLIQLKINAGSTLKSVADTYNVETDDCVDPTNDLVGKTFNVSLEVFNAMLSQLKTPFVALDFNCADGNTCIRLAEINNDAESKEYTAAREKTAELCSQQGIEFDPMATPTPLEFKLDYRERTLMTKQFTMLAK